MPGTEFTGQPPESADIVELLSRQRRQQASAGLAGSCQSGRGTAVPKRRLAATFRHRQSVRATSHPLELHRAVLFETPPERHQHNRRVAVFV